MNSSYGSYHARPAFGRRTSASPQAPSRPAAPQPVRSEAPAARPVANEDFDSGFSIGKVLISALGVLGSHAPTFVALLGLAMLPERAIYHFSGLDGKLLDAASGFTLSLTGLWLQLAIMRMTLDGLQDGRASFGTAVGQAFRSFFPVLGLSLLAAVPLVLACLLLLVPGVMLGLSWSLLAPVRVAEGAGLMACFRRSRELTRGHRWQILAIFLILGLVLGPVLFLLGTLWGMLLGTEVLFMSQNWLARLLFQAAIGLMLAATYAGLQRDQSVDLDAFD